MELCGNWVNDFWLPLESMANLVGTKNQSFVWATMRLQMYSPNKLPIMDHGKSFGIRT